MKLSELLLGMGLAAAALGAGLCQFVMVGLIGLALLVLALALLMVAGLMAHSADEPSARRKLAGLLFHLLGAVLLIVVAFYASQTAFNRALEVERAGAAPAGGAVALTWGLVGLSSLVPALLVALGLRTRTRWPSSRCLLWGVAVLAVPLVAVLIFWCLYPTLPISA